MRRQGVLEKQKKEKEKKMIERIVEIAAGALVLSGVVICAVDVLFGPSPIV
jgi:hypothetical protein